MTPFILRSVLGFALIVMGIIATPSVARADGGTLIVKSKYFSVMGPQGMDVFDVLSKIHYDYFAGIDGIGDRGRSDPAATLGKTIDAVFNESAHVLGINVYSFDAIIEFLPDQNGVRVRIKNVAGVDVNERAFYLHDLKTIFISINDLTVGMLGHEIAHALVSHYFGAPPAANIQEILAGYVDYALSKRVR